MECNKGEAVRAMEIAERKFTERNYSSAKKFLLKAQNLYPELEGLSQMLVTFDVYASSEKQTINGEVDWYSILGLKPRSDDETVRKQYRKLALMLHPDKNKSLGADGAFKLVSEAWSFLSNKAKKFAYDENLSAANGFYHGTNLVNTDSRARNIPSASCQKPETFWTICNRCKTQYEYLRMYLNHTLLCPNCHEAFLAIEKAPPPTLMKSSVNPARHKHQSSKNRVANNSSSVNSNGSELHRNHFSTSGVKREFEEEKTAVDRLFKRITDDTNYGASSVNGISSSGSFEQKRGNFETDRAYGFSGNNKANIKRELSPLELRNLLIHKAHSDITQKLQEWRDQSESDTSQTNNRKSTPGFKNILMSINVPDPDFHNFDLDRTESSFGEDQVWAAYDADDGMPRYYARIQKVMTKKPFKMKISWLNSRSCREFSSINWVGSGFLKTCGDFRAGRYETTQRLNSFSHKVKWQKGFRGLIRILPTKGDIWALYQNWAPDWNQNTPDEVIHKYDMVEVVEDYNEEKGVSVAPLNKVSGFKTVFRRNADENEVIRIPNDEMFRLSHQVPYHVLTGEESPDSPKGCLELDPAATPLELLRVIPEANEGEMVNCSDCTPKSETTE